MNFVHDRHSPFAMSRLRLFPLSCAHYIVSIAHSIASPFAMSRLRLFPLSCAHYITSPRWRALPPAAQAARSLMAQEKQMPPSASLVFLSLSRSRARAPRFFACSAGCPLATRTRKTNAAFGVACFSFVLGTLYSRCLLTSTKLLVQYRKFC